ncbi:hypothetical protein [Noviherbaspirillum saxi]|nr:hypothetical protein [Noviherbaspirillum saxi]
MKNLILIAAVLLAGCSTFAPTDVSHSGMHPTELPALYDGGG